MDFRAKLISWEQIEKWCEIIKEKVSNSFRPDIIVGLSRGGLVPARMLSDMLWIKDLISIKTEHWGITATASGKAVLKDPGRLNIEGKRVLVVDDITDTGQSMKLAYDFILGQKPAEVRTVTMLHITRSAFIPDFYAELVDEKNWAWFIFPWNVYEDILNLVSRVLTSPMSTESISNALKDSFDLNMDHGRLKDLLNYFAKRKRVMLSSQLWHLPNPVK